jgi:hypothetical protein
MISSLDQSSQELDKPERVRPWAESLIGPAQQLAISARGRQVVVSVVRRATSAALCGDKDRLRYHQPPTLSEQLLLAYASGAAHANAADQPRARLCRAKWLAVRDDFRNWMVTAVRLGNAR